MNKVLEPVDDYIAQFPERTQNLLRQIRGIVLNSHPNVEEKLSYGVPYYKLGGRLVYFGGFKDHISLFPMRSGLIHFQKELTNYAASAGTVQFPLDKPLPLDLIKKIIAFRVQENLDKSKPL